MSTRYLLRHCQYANPRNIIVGRLPVVLSEEGELEALKLKDYFADKQIERIYSSAVERCKQTATVVADGKINLIYDQRILEGFSAYQGYWMDEQTPPWIDYYSHRNELGGENVQDVQKRMVDFWLSLSNITDNLILCSHGDPLYTLYSYLTHTDISGLEEAVSQSKDYIPKGAFWQFEGEGEDWKLVGLTNQADLSTK